jgi:ethanolaminephosphotransferase
MVLIRYISPQGLEALKLYRYHCDDKSLVAFYIMQPFWRWAVNLLPIWIAYVTMAWIGLDWIGLDWIGLDWIAHRSIIAWIRPNAVTLIGFSLIVLHYLTMYMYVPSMIGQAPNWVYLLAGICIFSYQTLDALDGKQVWW